MGRGQFINHKLGKIVHRGIDQHLWKAKMSNHPKEARRVPTHSGNAVETAEENKKADESGKE